jgi:hypothetical protein
VFAAAAELGKQPFDFLKHDHPDAIARAASKSKAVLERVNWENRQVDWICRVFQRRERQLHPGRCRQRGIPWCHCGIRESR